MNRFYDQIACEYDQLVQEDIQNNRFPYGAYGDMQDIVAEYIFENKHITQAKILDIGIGTGSLYEKIMPEKIAITGIDFSDRMLEVAHLRLPEAILYKHDIRKGMPRQIANEQYDFIVVNYLFKHFDVKMLIDMVHQLVRYLSPFGKIFIGDILFLDEARRKNYLSDHPDHFYQNYFYHSYSDIVQQIDDQLALSYMELNEYTGIVIIEKYYETSLHFEETLIKYKTNTVKWKSNQTQKDRE